MAQIRLGDACRAVLPGDQLQISPSEFEANQPFRNLYLSYDSQAGYVLD